MNFSHEIVKFLPFGVTHGTFNIEKWIPRSKIKEKVSSNYFPDSFLSHTKSPDPSPLSHGAVK